MSKFKAGYFYKDRRGYTCLVNSVHSDHIMVTFVGTDDDPTWRPIRHNLDGSYTVTGKVQYYDLTTEEVDAKGNSIPNRSLKLEVGKVYLSTQGIKWKIFHEEGGIFLGHREKFTIENGAIIKYKSSGEELWDDGTASLIEEYKEPEVRYVNICKYENGDLSVQRAYRCVEQAKKNMTDLTVGRAKVTLVEGVWDE